MKIWSRLYNMYKMFCDVCGAEMPEERATRSYVTRNIQAKYTGRRDVHVRLEVRAMNQDMQGQFQVDVCVKCLAEIANEVTTKPIIL